MLLMRNLLLIIILTFSTIAFGLDTSLSTSHLKNDRGQKFPVSVLKYEYLEQIFDWIVSHEYIPFKYPREGCRARALAMNILMEEVGITSANVFIEGNLRVETPYLVEGYVLWSNHVAPVVKAERDGKIDTYVIDPSIFDHPVKVKEWRKIQVRHRIISMAKTYFTPQHNFDGGYVKNDFPEGYSEIQIRSMNRSLSAWKSHEGYELQKVKEYKEKKI